MAKQYLKLAAESRPVEVTSDPLDNQLLDAISCVILQKKLVQARAGKDIQKVARAIAKNVRDMLMRTFEPSEAQSPQPLLSYAGREHAAVRELGSNISVLMEDQKDFVPLEPTVQTITLPGSPDFRPPRTVEVGIRRQQSLQKGLIDPDYALSTQAEHTLFPALVYRPDGSSVTAPDWRKKILDILKEGDEDGVVQELLRVKNLSVAEDVAVAQKDFDLKRGKFQMSARETVRRTKDDPSLLKSVAFDYRVMMAFEARLKPQDVSVEERAEFRQYETLDFRARKGRFRRALDAEDFPGIYRGMKEFLTILNFGYRMNGESDEIRSMIDEGEEKLVDYFKAVCGEYTRLDNMITENTLPSDEELAAFFTKLDEAKIVFPFHSLDWEHYRLVISSRMAMKNSGAEIKQRERILHFGKREKYSVIDGVGSALDFNAQFQPMQDVLENGMKIFRQFSLNPDSYNPQTLKAFCEYLLISAAFFSRDDIFQEVQKFCDDHDIRYDPQKCIENRKVVCQDRAVGQFRTPLVFTLLDAREGTFFEKAPTDSVALADWARNLAKTCSDFSHTYYEVYDLNKTLSYDELSPEQRFFADSQTSRFLSKLFDFLSEDLPKRPPQELDHAYAVMDSLLQELLKIYPADGHFRRLIMNFYWLFVSLQRERFPAAYENAKMLGLELMESAPGTLYIHETSREETHVDCYRLLRDVRDPDFDGFVTRHGQLAGS